MRRMRVFRRSDWRNARNPTRPVVRTTASDYAPSVLIRPAGLLTLRHSSASWNPVRRWPARCPLLDPSVRWGDGMSNARHRRSGWRRRSAMRTTPALIRITVSTRRDPRRSAVLPSRARGRGEVGAIRPCSRIAACGATPPRTPLPNPASRAGQDPTAARPGCRPRPWPAQRRIPRGATGAGSPGAPGTPRRRRSPTAG